MSISHLDRPLSDVATLGAVYTPETLALAVADLIAHDLPDGATVFDPACGDGSLLEAVQTLADRPLNLVGFDIDNTAISQALNRLGHKARILQIDSLNTTLDQHDISPDVFIMNPPWGNMTRAHRNILLSRNYYTAVGQYDAFDTFIEWAIINAPAGAQIVAILPDSLFGKSHTRLRQLIARETEMNFVCRIGEGWFDSVYRSACVIHLTKGKVAADHLTKIGLLTRRDREAIISNHTRQSLLASVHKIERQETILEDPDSNLTFAAVTSSHNARTRLGDVYSVSRGIEIGKNSTLVSCSRCYTRRISRRATKQKCTSCGSDDSIQLKSLVSRLEESTDTGIPMIVGEDVQRYDVTPSRIVSEGCDLIDYKNLAQFAVPKVLVRKTGLGIIAAFDSSKAATNQVVYNITARDRRGTTTLKALTAILNSRYIHALHLAHSGEFEWKSLPYLTLGALRDFPVPDDILTSPYVSSLSEALDNQTLRILDPQKYQDRIDSLVFDWYDISFNERNEIAAILMKTQELAAFKLLRGPISS